MELLPPNRDVRPRVVRESCHKIFGCIVVLSETLIPSQRVKMPKSQVRSVLSLALLVLGTACSLIEPREVVPVEFAYGIHRL